MSSTFPPSPASGPSDLAGALVADRYAVQDVLGEGATARTYLATDTLFGGQVVLKVLGRRELSTTLRHEFTVLRGLVHPNINPPRAYGVDTRSQPHVEYLVSDFVAGVTLTEFAVGKTWTELRPVMLDMLVGLGFLHARGMGHGDVKPSNVVVDARGRGTLIDFGCARRLGSRSDTFSGTLAFAAPETLRGGAFDARADLYALAKTLEHVVPLTTSTPTSRERQLLSTLTSPIPSARPADVSQVLEALGEQELLDEGARGEAPGFVGRQSELERLERVLKEHVAGTRGVRWVHIWGPAGVGSSRLLEELTLRAQLVAPVWEAASSRHQGIRELGARVTGSNTAPHLERAVTRWRRSAVEGIPIVAVIDDVHSVPSPELRLLLALVRTCEPSDRILCLSSGHAPLDVDSDAVLQLSLGPLDRQSVALWRSATGTALSDAQLYAKTSGFPAAIRQALGQDSEHPNVAALSLPEQQALALLVVGAEELSSVDARTWASLNGRGWVNRSSGRFTLLHSMQRQTLAGQLPREVIEWAHETCAAQLRRAHAAPDGAPSRLPERVRARLARHELGRDRARTALELATDAQPAHDWVPLADELLRYLERRATRAAGHPVGEQERVAVVELGAFACRALMDAGQEAANLRLLARVFGLTPAAGRTPLFEIAAEHWLRTGRPKRSRRLARRALELRERAGQPTVQALTLLARVELQLGRYDPALGYVTAALRQATDEALRAELQQVRAVAWTYQGKTTEAIELLRPLASEFERLGRRRQQSRCLSYIAIAHFRRGELESARSCYEEAFATAEDSGDADLIAGALLNKATLEQQLGSWGAALRGYERALVLARALGRQGTVLTLRFNLGNLAQQIGAFEHAERTLGSVLDEAERAENGPVMCSTHSALAELSLHQGRLHVARVHAQRALERARALGATREAAEAQLLTASIELSTEDVTAARQLLDSSVTEDHADLKSVHQLALARCRLAEAEPGSAAEAARAALDAAQRAAHPGLEARAQTLLFQVLNASRDPSALAHRDHAWRIYNRIAADLPESYREMFWEHPERLPLLAAPQGTQAEPSFERGRLQRFLAVNRRINSTLSIDQVLAAALDAAIELTGAERGFVLIASEKDGVLTPRAMRNISQLKLEDESMSFSRSIAERVLRSERAVVTVDATSDARFALQSSVHAMQLKSVACVPFASAAGLCGVLYVDNRVQMGRFADDDTTLLIALGDQVAIALDNAHLHAELVQRSQELERAKRAAEKHVVLQRRLISDLEKTVERQQLTLNNRYAYEQIVGRGPAMQRVLAVLDRVIETDVTVLLEGESGTGKELFARAIHHNSKRRDGAFVSINCGALPEALLESELFGHRKGAFSGAAEDRVGLLQAGHGGTVFLDEVGEMPLSLQVKLLRALQERSVRPLGASKEEPVDIRIVAATNRHLDDEVAKGSFREDLFFRLSVVQVRVPPLRERSEDLPELCAALLHRIALRTGVPEVGLSRAALRRLMGQSWPGNVRQLENVLTKAALLCDGTILPEHLDVQGSMTPRPTARARGQFEREEADRIFASLRTHAWNVSAVARALDMPRNTLYRKMKRYRLERERAEAER